jgi:hypothetical protein
VPASGITLADLIDHKVIGMTTASEKWPSFSFGEIAIT